MQQFIEHETGHLAPTTMQTCVAIISAAFAWGVKCGLIDSNPCYRMIPRAKPPSKRALTGVERQTIMHDDGPRGDYWRFLLLTGMRRSELANLLAEDIDLGADEVHVVGAKGDKNRDISLVAEARTIARRLILAAPEGHVVRTQRTICGNSGQGIGSDSKSPGTWGCTRSAMTSFRRWRTTRRLRSQRSSSSRGTCAWRPRRCTSTRTPKRCE